MIRRSDIDIWIPYGPAQEDDMGKFMALLVSMGYTMRYRKNIRDAVPPNERQGLPDAYKRVQDMIRHMCTYSHENLRSVQLLCVSQQGGNTPTGIIKHFDLNLNRQYYDGSKLFASKSVRADIQASRITLNMGSVSTREQSFPEWRRTAGRILKYVLRGYTIDPSVPELLLQYVPVALKAIVAWDIFFEFHWDTRPLIATNIDGNAMEWNRIAFDLARAVGELTSLTPEERDRFSLPPAREAYMLNRRTIYIGTHRTPVTSLRPPGSDEPAAPEIDADDGRWNL